LNLSTSSVPTKLIPTLPEGPLSNISQEIVESLQEKVWLYIQTSSCCQEHEALLQHQLDHYINTVKIQRNQIFLDVHSTIEASETEHTRAEILMQVAERWNVTKRRKLLPSAFSAISKLYRMYELQRKHKITKRDQWMISSDSDELVDFGEEGVGQLINTLNREGFDAVESIWIDRFALKGRISNISAFPSLREQFPLLCNGTYLSFYPQNVNGTVWRHDKITLRRASVLVDPGSHSVTKKKNCNLFRSFLPPNLTAETFCSFIQEMYPSVVRHGTMHHFKWHSGVNMLVNTVRNNAAAIRANLTERERSHFKRIIYKYDSLLKAIGTGYVDISQSNCTLDKALLLRDQH
jgi:hypothetical protein